MRPHPQRLSPFWQKVGLSPFLVCERLYAARGDLVRMRAVALHAIAERGQ